jgi:uncharacterized protein YecE (DUF72 family)
VADAKDALRLGCASWSLPRDIQDQFPGDAPHLARYATRLNAVEINSSFHRPHSRATYERWAASVPPSFRFAVKLPRTITHERRLADAAPLLDEFLAQASGLGDRLECLLVQMPPSLAFDAATATSFFDVLRERWSGRIAAEPRHASWFDSDVDAFLARRRIARVLADPVRNAGGEHPGGWPDLVYLRLHGSPRVYYSSYAPEVIEALARRIALALQSGQHVWCIFDNTASGAATHDALALEAALQRAGGTAASDERR